MKLYLDIDGVLLGKTEPDSPEVVLAKHAKEFLEYCVNNFDCYWLTTHCRDGDITGIINIMRRYADDKIIEGIRKIQPTKWNTLKTEAIDFTSDFYWFDDQPLQSELAVLEEKGRLNRLIRVDTRNNPDDLSRVLSLLEKRV